MHGHLQGCAPARRPVGLGQGAVEAVELTPEVKGHSFLVTGGYGLLGGWLVRALLEGGARVTVLRRDQTGRSGLAAMDLETALDVVAGDVTNGALIERI